jgi:chemotaxis protein CheC
MTSSPALLQAHQLDALREVANIGAGHAATALSQMIDVTVMITVPRISIARLQDMPPVVKAPEEPVAAVLLRVIGDLTGRALLVFPRQVAVRLCELLLRRPVGTTLELGKVEQSVINEIGNILSSAYMNALGSFMGMILLPMPPNISVSTSAALMTAAHLDLESHDQVLCVESEFLLQGFDEPLRGLFLLLPDPDSLTAILKAVHVA